MSLLREIQNAAIDSKIELATLLRKCKVLAARLGNTEFKKWIEHELSGYKDVKNLPDYRIITVRSKGHFSGPFQSGLRNADIPLSCINEELHEMLSHTYFMESVASLESLIENIEGGTAQEPWDADIVAHVGQNIYENMNCMQAWKVVPKSSIVGALEAVRNRILNFVLEIEAEAPDAGEAPVNSTPVSQEKIHQIFNTYITGDVQNVATGSSDFKQESHNSNMNKEVFDEIINVLSKSTVEQELVTSLTTIVEDMKISQGTNEFKENYQKFMSSLSDHMTVIGPIIAPYLPILAKFIP